jgi:hypothetical protein
MGKGETMPERNLIVGYYTAGDYEQEAHQHLISSVEALGLPAIFQVIPHTGSWENIVLSRFLIFEQLCNDQPNNNFLFLDSDAVVHSDPWPFLLSLKCDVACHFFRDIELLCSMLYFPAGPNRVEILARWNRMNAEDTRKEPGYYPDQRNLQALLETNPQYITYRLPPEYNCIFDLQRRLTRKIKPVIEQFQASRRLKKRARLVCQQNP